MTSIAKRTTVTTTEEPKPMEPPAAMPQTPTRRSRARPPLTPSSIINRARSLSISTRNTSSKNVDRDVSHSKTPTKSTRVGGHKKSFSVSPVKSGQKRENKHYEVGESKEPIQTPESHSKIIQSATLDVLSEKVTNDEGKAVVKNLWGESATQKSSKLNKKNLTLEDGLGNDGSIEESGVGTSTPTRNKSNNTPFGGFGTPSRCASPTVQKVYSIIRKSTGTIGGNGSGGPIYGELTVGSMQKVVDLMKDHCGLDQNSMFIDVGAGLGKPNFHVAQDPGVAFSYGIELEEVRWQLSMHNFNEILKAVSKEKKKENKDTETAGDTIKHNLYFHCGDITEATTFDPFTHVYMFDIGFPPALFFTLAEMFNTSSSPYLICYHGPKLMIENYGFEIELLTQEPTSMHGSSEGHSVYIYSRSEANKKKAKRRLNSSGSNSKTSSFKCDPLFERPLKLVQGPFEKLYDHVRGHVMAQLCSPRAQRTRPTRLGF